MLLCFLKENLYAPTFGIYFNRFCKVHVPIIGNQNIPIAVVKLGKEQFHGISFIFNDQFSIPGFNDAGTLYLLISFTPVQELFYRFFLAFKNILTVIKLAHAKQIYRF